MDTGQMIADRIEALIGQRGTNPRAVALAAGMSPTGVRDIITRKTKNPTYANLAKIAEVLGVEVSDFVSGPKPEKQHAISHQVTVAVPGFVGAGAEVDLSDPYPKGEGMYKVVCPPQLDPHGVVAVEVRGDSMEPVFSEGDLLFYTRNGANGVPTEAIGRKCVAETEDGKVWVKQLKVGTEPGLFHLLSLNPCGRNLLNTKVKWAAPVRLHLPAELVIKF